MDHLAHQVDPNASEGSNIFFVEKTGSARWQIVSAEMTRM
jgi:hypothetical protein